MFNPVRFILPIILGMILAAVSYGDIEAAEPIDSFANDSPCPAWDPNGKAPPGQPQNPLGTPLWSQYTAPSIGHWESFVCSETELFAILAINQAIQDVWRLAEPDIVFSDLPCATFAGRDALDPNLVVFLSSQGANVDSPRTWNRWTTFGGVEVCTFAQRLGKDPITQLATRQGRPVATVRAELITAAYELLGTSLSISQPNLVSDMLNRLYPSQVSGFDPPRNQHSHTAIDSNPLSPCWGLMAWQCQELLGGQ